MNVKTNNMNRIKFTSKTTLTITEQDRKPIKYKGYEVGSLLPSFGHIFYEDKDGVSKWFNYKGLTYIAQ